MKVQVTRFIVIAILLVLKVDVVSAQNNTLFESRLDNTGLVLSKTGKGECYISDNKLSSRGAYASFGEPDWENYRMSFEARVPETEEQVQIWVSFREQGRNERYLLGLKGGFQNDIELARMGLMGDDAFLGIRKLDFEPSPGQWYQISIEVCGNRVRVFLNNEDKPRIDVIDEHADLLPAGKVALGGSWIKTEFRNLKVVELPEDYLHDEAIDEYSNYRDAAAREVKRKADRQLYKAVVIPEILQVRSEFSLDGFWLFKPGYEIKNQMDAVSNNNDDQDWHIIDVPNFWNPSRIWLHGERFMQEGHPKGASDSYFQRETDRCENYTFDYKQTRVGWYRQWMELPESIDGKHLELSFDAVSKVAEVYVNGTKAGANVGMFGDFTLDVSKLLKPGKNLVAVKVMRDYVEDIDNADEVATIAVTVEVTNQMLKDLPHGFFRENPAGIWQPVKLIVTEPVKIEDVYIKPDLAGAGFEVTIKNYGPAKSLFHLYTQITDRETGNLLHSEQSIIKQALAPGVEEVFTYSVENLKPRLWSPEEPNLYDFSFSIVDAKSKKSIDARRITSGFRTFEARGDYFYLNGKRYWLRGANHTPHALGINDAELAEKTFELYHDGNIAVTRSHTIPYSEVWLKAADEKGVGVSFEGTWPWLMIGVGENSIPDQELLDVWRDEWLRLMSKYRNHPSILYWTINNEMNFTHNRDDVDRIETKMGIVSSVVKQMRNVDQTRPLCFDSGYTRKEVRHRHDSTFYEKYDDGDIDDGHNYSGWYHSSIFDNFAGAPFMGRKTEGRPLITQEWSTGYPNTETGHHTRSYLWEHQNTQTHVGNQAYPFGNPDYSLENNAFLSSELLEAVRRTHDRMAGMHNFSSITWFQNVYDAQRVKPYPTYYRMKNSLSPVLVSAELWGRHFYAGEKLPARFCIVNDKVDGETLAPSVIRWEISYKDNRVVSSGTVEVPEVEHYSRKWISPEIILPENFEGERLSAKLRLFLTRNGSTIAHNEYDILVAKNSWITNESTPSKNIVLVDFTGNTSKLLKRFNLGFKRVDSIKTVLNQEADLYIISGIYKERLSQGDIALINESIQKGSNLLILNAGSKARDIFPGYISGYVERPGETAHMDIEESGIFCGIEYMELRYFNNDQPSKPLVYSGLLQTFDLHGIKAVSSACQHRYARGKDRRAEMLRMKGFPIVVIENEGKVILSEMMTDKGLYDPVAAKLLSNMINEFN